MGYLTYAQNKQLLYDFTEIPQALMLNPGMETDFNWYAGIPVLSGISVHAVSDGISVNTFLPMTAWILMIKLGIGPLMQ